MARCPISMIITVYNNNEETLAGCLDSLIAQGAWDSEIIIVNNGSTIESVVALCEDYRGRHSRAKVVHMEHDTPAAAYNRGLEAATCRYVHFMDADDRLEEDAMEKIAPIMLQNFDVIFLDTTFCDSPGFWDISHTNILRRLSQSIPFRLWDKIIRRDLLIKEDITFSKGVILESVDFCMNLYIHAQTYGAVDFPYYRRRAEFDKYTQYGKYAEFAKKVDLDAEDAFNRVILTLAKWVGPAESTYEEYGAFIYDWMIAMYCELLLPMYRRLSKGSRRLCRSGMEDFRWLLDIQQYGKSQTLKILCTIFGPLCTSYLMAALDTIVKGMRYTKWKKLKLRLSDAGKLQMTSISRRIWQAK